MNFISQLTNRFKANANPEYASQMQAYMKDHFVFFGLKAKLRRQLLKQVAEHHRLEIRDTIKTLVFDLYALPQREMHYCAIELFEKQLRNSYKPEDIDLIEKLITSNSWWDTVDFISKHSLGNYLQQFPEAIPKTITKFSTSHHMWLNRCAITFQLGYKEKTDNALLFKLCSAHKDSEEFFIQKAIGWALREYGKSNPKAVLEYANSANLKPLSYREAIRNIA